MDGDQARAGGHSATGEFGGVARGIVPAKPHLDRHRHLHGGDRRLDQRHRMVEIAHQGRAGPAARHLLGRAAHVDVNDRSAIGFRQAGGLAQPMRIAAGELDDMRRDAGALGPQPRFLAAAHELVGGDHFETTRPAPKRAAIRRMTISVTPDIGASRARDTRVTGSIAAMAEPELEATCIMHIYWTMLQERKGLSRISALHHQRSPGQHRSGLGAWRRCHLRLSPNLVQDKSRARRTR